jgi:hypothetical protein
MKKSPGKGDPFFSGAREMACKRFSCFLDENACCVSKDWTIDFPDNWMLL